MVIKFIAKEPLKVWKFASRTEKGVIYNTGLWSDGRITCDCPASSFRKRLCWHKENVMHIIELEFGSNFNAIEFYKDERRKKREKNIH